MKNKNKKSEKELEKDWEEAMKKDKKAEQEIPAGFILEKESEKVVEKKIKSRKGRKSLKRTKEEVKKKKKESSKKSSEEVSVKITIGQNTDDKIKQRINREPKKNANEKPIKKTKESVKERKVVKARNKKKDEKKVASLEIRRGGEKKEIKKGDIKKSVCKNTIKCLSFFQKNNWVFTILFFVIILIVSVWIWQRNIQNPLPDEEVMINFLQSQDEKKEKSEKIEKVIKKLQERKKNFMNPPNLENQREIFKNKDEPDYLNVVSDDQESEVTNIQ